MSFSEKTFQYFNQAKKNKNNLTWFEKNKASYESDVRIPFEQLIIQIRKHLQSELPRIDINPRSITRPLRPKNRASREGGLVKDFSFITIWEKRTSLFEWNPGIHIQFSADKDENFIGIGLYMVSSRQLSLLRNSVTEDFEKIDEILNNKKLKKIWGPIQGEKYKRFPKGFNPEDPRSLYLWNKQFYLSKKYSLKEIKSKNFSKMVIQDLKVVMPFFQWVRKSVGIYKK